VVIINNKTIKTATSSKKLQDDTDAFNVKF